MCRTSLKRSFVCVCVCLYIYIYIMRRRLPLVLLVTASPLASLCLSVNKKISLVGRTRSSHRSICLHSHFDRHEISACPERRIFIAAISSGVFVFSRGKVAAADDNQVVGARNRRIGGLANKIRNIGRVMVRSAYFSLAEYHTDFKQAHEFVESFLR